MADPNDLSSLPQADQDAIATTLGRLLTGFSERDAETLVGIYAPDVDWVNAFGTVKRGHDGGGVPAGAVRRRQLQRRHPHGPPEIAFKVLTPEVVLVSAHLQVQGQKFVDGGEIEVRDNPRSGCCSASPGAWLIVSEMYNDANREETYEGHS